MLTSTSDKFPEFSKMTLADKTRFELLTKDFPPIYDISFHGLMTWWNTFDNMAVARLYDNLVLPYWLPGDEQNSGLCMLGVNKVDESICEVFDHLRRRGDPVRLVNVPEFVVSCIRYPEMFAVTEQRDMNEYIVPLSRFYPMQGMASHWKRKVERQIREVGEDNIVARSVDMQIQKDKELLLAAAEKWRVKNRLNDYGKLEGEVIQASIEQADALDLGNICLFVNGKLRGFCLFQSPPDKRYAIVKHVKATHESMFGFELIAYKFAEWLTEHGYSYVNLGADSGIQHLRTFMLTLGPVNFFRKYTIEPTS